MLKNKSILEVQKQDKLYQFVCSPDAPLGEIYDSLCQMLHFVVQKMNESVPKEDKSEEKACDEKCEEKEPKNEE